MIWISMYRTQRLAVCIIGLRDKFLFCSFTNNTKFVNYFHIIKYNSYLLYYLFLYYLTHIHTFKII